MFTCQEFYWQKTDVFLEMKTQVKTPYIDENQPPYLEIVFTTENDFSLHVHFSSSSPNPVETNFFSRETLAKIPEKLPAGVTQKLRYAGHECEVMLIKSSKHAINFKIGAETHPSYVNQYKGGYSVVVQLFSRASTYHLTSLPGALKGVNISHNNLFSRNYSIDAVVVWLNIKGVMEEIFSELNFEQQNHTTIARLFGMTPTCKPFGVYICFPLTSHSDTLCI